MWEYEPYNALAHHGILGMKHDKRMGPPYPLPEDAHSAAEKKAGWRKSLNAYTEIAMTVSSKKKTSSVDNKKNTEKSDTESEQVTENKSDNASSKKGTKKSSSKTSSKKGTKKSSSKTSSKKGTKKSSSNKETLINDNRINVITRGERLHSGRYRITGGKSGEIKLSEQEISRNHQAKVKRLLKKVSKSTKSSNTVKGKAIADKLLNK